MPRRVGELPSCSAEAPIDWANVNVGWFGSGCDGHPTVATHEGMAARLVEALGLHLGGSSCNESPGPCQGDMDHRRLLILALAIAACDTTSDTPAGKTDAKSGETKPAAAPVAKANGWILDATMSSGQQLRGVPTECRISETGKSVVVADDGRFDLRFEDKQGRLVWKHAAGDVDEPIVIEAMGEGWVRINGMTAAGAGYDGEITCK